MDEKATIIVNQLAMRIAQLEVDKAVLAGEIADLRKGLEDERNKHNDKSRFSKEQ